MYHPAMDALYRSDHYAVGTAVPPVPFNVLPGLDRMNATKYRESKVVAQSCRFSITARGIAIHYTA